IPAVTGRNDYSSRAGRAGQTMVATHHIAVQTRGQDDADDLAERVANAVREAGIADGIVTVFVVGSTASITTIEFEPGAIADLNRVFEGLAPRKAEYQHHL